MTLAISELTVRHGSHEILHGVSVPPLEPGTVVGLIGPNSAGKSTLLKTIVGINKPASGSIALGDARVGYVPQDLLTSASLTAFESVVASCGRGASRRIERSAEVLDELGISHLAHRFISELSGGQRQLVGVAQMLVRDPELLLLDEPTSALDIRHQIDLLQLITDHVRNSEAVALVALHDLNLAARFCDQLIVLADGEVLDVGTPTAVLTPDTLMKVYGFRARVMHDADDVPVVCPVAAKLGRVS